MQNISVNLNGDVVVKTSRVLIDYMGQDLALEIRVRGHVSKGFGSRVS